MSNRTQRHKDTKPRREAGRSLPAREARSARRVVRGRRRRERLAEVAKGP
ncbi:MAG: hypothetical protein [Olavius algarvensis Gamma 1 endosymbiont]|nr:MAG: hypothetical protein [Olavius algarvensis Gamma 1 endosymbiont]